MADLSRTVDCLLAVLQLRVEAYEVLRPDVRVQEDVLIDVIRNPSAPIFGSNFYTSTIPESLAQGFSVLRVSATDSDGVSSVGMVALDG